MASFSVARQSQANVAQSNGSNAISFGSSRGSNVTSTDDPLHPLRAMADRVGKEVEKFAERVDHWHTHGNENATAKHQTTVKMVNKFRDLAESQAKDLKRAHEAENKGDLSRRVRRRIQDMEDVSGSDRQNNLAQSSQLFVSSLGTSVTPTSTSVRELREWQQELATWELLRIMIDHYYPEPGTNTIAEKEAAMSKLSSAGHVPNSEVWDKFLLQDDQAKEKALVLRWLEQTARNSDSDIQTITAELEAHSGKDTKTWTSGWLDTKSKIKQAKRMEGTDKPLNPDVVDVKSGDRTQSLVTQLDPDAPRRQKRELERSDEFYERALWLVCYEMLRRGVPWSEISEWAQERNEAWRGVSVGAATEAHPAGAPNLAGATFGYLYRRMCFYASRGARFPYEGAVYGLLSGNVKQAEAVSRSWDDHLYVHYNALLLSRFDTYLQNNYTDRISPIMAQNLVFQDAVANIGDWEGSSRKVVEIMKEQAATANEALSPIKLIQGALLSRTTHELLFKVGIVLSDLFLDDEHSVNLMLHHNSTSSKPTCRPTEGVERTTVDTYYNAFMGNPHAFRILVHVFIVLGNGLNCLDQRNRIVRDTRENVIAAYVEFLRTTKRIQLIPLYAAQLESDRCAYVLSRVMPDIRNTEEQRRCISLMYQYRVDANIVLAEAITSSFRKTGYTQLEGNTTCVSVPFARYELVEVMDFDDPMSFLWPSLRVKKNLQGSDVNEKDMAIIEILRWFQHIVRDYEETFFHLGTSLVLFLLNGRLGAAEMVADEFSVEELSMSRTEALCGYPFDVTQPGAEVQDEAQLHAHRKSLTGVARATMIPFDELPSPEQHEAIVNGIRSVSAEYQHVQQMVRLMILIREWRVEEEVLIKVRAQSLDGTQARPDFSRVRELIETIDSLFDAQLAFVSELRGPNGPGKLQNLTLLHNLYFPEIVLAYLSIMQTASFFLARDATTAVILKGMELAVQVADESGAWLANMFMDTGRMEQLVHVLAQMSRAMLKLGEQDGGGKIKRGRGWRGETVQIWEPGRK